MFKKREEQQNESYQQAVSERQAVNEHTTLAERFKHMADEMEKTIKRLTTDDEKAQNRK